ncbi:hypothetical protein, partial [Lacticaseibacillus paracasei]|uniref:hypothetical protein n=1 Tax=Lacticaseibacillus paracasei TaxID=1597 RepID=UPI001CDC2E3E
TIEGILDYIHADLWGPSCKSSLAGARYMLTIIDDYFRKVWPYFNDWKVMVERQTKRKVKILRTNNGMEFC